MNNAYNSISFAQTQKSGVSERVMDYRDYLKTPHWQQVQQAALARAKHRCQVCDGRDRLEVHHRTYVRRGREQPEDVTVLCHGCHETFHKQRKLAHTRGASPALKALVKRQMGGAA